MCKNPEHEITTAPLTAARRIQWLTISVADRRTLVLDASCANTGKEIPIKIRGPAKLVKNKKQDYASLNNIKNGSILP
jgi:hypothetical protein